MPLITKTERIPEFKEKGILVNYLNELVRVLRNNFSVLESFIEYRSNYYDCTRVTTPVFDIQQLLPMFLCDSSSNNITVNLPSASRYFKKFVYFKKTNTANTVTIVPAGSETIDNTSSFVLTSSYLDSATLYSDGENWWVI